LFWLFRGASLTPADRLFATDSLTVPDLLFVIHSLTFADLLSIIYSFAVPDLLYVIEDTREKRRKGDEGTGTKRRELIKSNAKCPGRIAPIDGRNRSQTFDRHSRQIGKLPRPTDFESLLAL
jgi:hypothetical protein